MAGPTSGGLSFGQGLTDIAPSSALVIGAGATAITGGSAGQLLYDTGGTLGETSTLVYASNTLTGSASLVFNFGSSGVSSPDVGISRTAAATIAVGNGTQGDISGTLIANVLDVGPGGAGANRTIIDAINNGMSCTFSNTTAAQYTIFGIVLNSGVGIQWSNNANNITSRDLSLSRIAQSVLAVGNGTIGDSTGTVLASFYENGARGAFSATTGAATMNVTTNNVFSVTPTGNITLTTTGTPPAGANYYIVVTTSGVSSFNITFSTGFKSTGVLATGTSSGKVFTMCFVSDGTNINEVSRTTAM